MSHVERTFVCEMNEEFGFLGFAPKDAPQGWDAFAENGIVHDFLEHGTGLDSRWTPEEEARAFGVIVWGRGCGGGLATLYASPADNLAPDLIRLTTEGNVPKYRRSCPLKDEYAESIINKAIRKAKRDLPYSLSEEDKEEQYALTRSLDRFRGWMRYGYRQAEKTYGKDFSQREFSDIFVAFRDEVTQKIKYCEEGDEMTLVLDLKTHYYDVIYTSRYELEEV